MLLRPVVFDESVADDTGELVAVGGSEAVSSRHKSHDAVDLTQVRDEQVLVVHLISGVW